MESRWYREGLGLSIWVDGVPFIEMGEARKEGVSVCVCVCVCVLTKEPYFWEVVIKRP